MAKLKIFFWLLILLLIIAALIYWSQRKKPVEVTIQTVTQGEIQHTITNTRAGTLNACRRARLSPSLGGQIANLPVSEGETVTSGQLLFEIWNRDLRAQLQLARSELLASQSL
jgi:HlyD family secretion protein